PIKVVDQYSFDNLLKVMDFIFGKFSTTDSAQNKLILRGKLEYKSRYTEPATGEELVIFTVSDPKAMYRSDGRGPEFIRVPRKGCPRSGIYAEVTVDLSKQHNPAPFSVEAGDIVEFDVISQMPMIDWDYEKTVKIAKKRYYLDLNSETGQRWKQVSDLTNFDFMLLPIIAGEFSHNHVKGGNSVSVVKTSEALGTYQLEAVDTFLNSIWNPASDSTCHKSAICGGNNEYFRTLLANGRREIQTSPYVNYYACNFGFSLNRESSSESTKLVETFESVSPESSVDLFNPVGNITAPSHSIIKGILTKDLPTIYSTRLFLLQTNLLPITATVDDVEKADPSLIRGTAMLKKLKDSIYRIGVSGFTVKDTEISSEDIEDAKRFKKLNQENMIKFILDG
ncbi:hypothetical protein HY497_01020, partial [Candidatus Woesearchaeota archaeon]|nr:hypothetical protein [Candidatus Woesearchaeota archaeon]